MTDDGEMSGVVARRGWAFSWFESWRSDFPDWIDMTAPDGRKVRYLRG